MHSNSFFNKIHTHPIENSFIEHRFTEVSPSFYVMYHHWYDIQIWCEHWLRLWADSKYATNSTLVNWRISISTDRQWWKSLLFVQSRHSNASSMEIQNARINYIIFWELQINLNKLKHLGLISEWKCPFTLRKRSYDHFTMGFLILVWRHLYNDPRPW